MIISPDIKKWSNNDIIIDFTPVSLGEWRDLFAQGIRPALTQSYDYARAISATSSLRPKWGIIREGHSRIPCGTVQLFESNAILSTLQTVIIDRGPVWFTPNPSIEWHINFWDAINKIYPRRLGRVRRFIPECPVTILSNDIMTYMGFVPRPRLKPYQTIFIDLTKSSEERRKLLRKSWQQSLNRAHRNQNLSVHHNKNIFDAIAILQQSRYDARHRGYPAPPQSLTEAMIKFSATGDGFDVFTVTDDTNQTIASALIIRHGSTATWQIGWVSEAGRSCNANHLLVWHIMETLASSGVKSLDLGGVNNDNAAGVNLFKSGIGGDHVTLGGAYG